MYHIFDKIAHNTSEYKTQMELWPSVELTIDNIVYVTLSYEPPKDKTNKMKCAHSEDSDQSGIHPV